MPLCTNQVRNARHSTPLESHTHMCAPAYAPAHPPARLHPRMRLFVENPVPVCHLLTYLLTLDIDSSSNSAKSWHKLWHKPRHRSVLDLCRCAPPIHSVYPLDKAARMWFILIRWMQ